MQNPLVEWFLNNSQSDPMKALDAACDYIKVLEARVSGGLVRAKPLKPALPPKVPHVAVDAGWPETT